MLLMVRHCLRTDEEEAKESVDMCAWFRMILEENGITQQRANQAAIIIQVIIRIRMIIILLEDSHCGIVLRWSYTYE